MSEGEREECSLHAVVETLKLPKIMTVRNEYLLNEKCALYKGQKLVLLQHQLVKLLFGTDWLGKEFRINTYEQANLYIDIVEAVYPKDLSELRSLLPDINYILSKSQYECDYAAAKNGEELKFDAGENFDDINNITLNTILNKKITVPLEVLLDKKYFVFVHLKERISLQMFFLIKNVFPQTVRFLNTSNYELPAGVVILQGVHVYDTILTVTKNQHNHRKLTYELFQLDSRIEVTISKEYLPKYVLSLGDYHSKRYRNKINEIKSAMHFDIYSPQFYGALVADKPSQKKLKQDHTRRQDSFDRVSPPKSLTGLMKKWKSCQSLLEENECPQSANLKGFGEKKRRLAVKKKGFEHFSSSEKDQIKDDIFTFPLMNENHKHSLSEDSIIEDKSNNTLCKSLDEKTLSSMISKEDCSTENDSCDKIIQKVEQQVIYENLPGFGTNVNSIVDSLNSKVNIEDESSNTLCKSLDEKTLSSMISKEDCSTENDSCDKIIQKMEQQVIYQNLPGFGTNVNSIVDSLNSKVNIEDESCNTLCKSLDEKTLTSMISKEDCSTEKDSCDKIIQKMEKQVIYENLPGFGTNVNSIVDSLDSEVNIECECKQCSNPLYRTYSVDTSNIGSFDLNNNSSEEKYENCIKKKTNRKIEYSRIGFSIPKDVYMQDTKKKSEMEFFLNPPISSASSYYTRVIYSDVQQPRVFSNDFQKQEIHSIEEVKMFSIEQVGQLLTTLKLSKYKDLFKKQLINGQLLFTLTEEAFREMKLTHFEARKLHKYIRGWRVNTKNCASNLQETRINHWSVKDVISVMEKINLKKLKVFVKENDVDGCLLKDIIDNGILKTLEKDYGIHLILVEQERLHGYLNNTLMYNEISSKT